MKKKVMLTLECRRCCCRSDNKWYVGVSNGIFTATFGEYSKAKAEKVWRSMCYTWKQCGLDGLNSITENARDVLRREVSRQRRDRKFVKEFVRRKRA